MVKKDSVYDASKGDIQLIPEEPRRSIEEEQEDGNRSVDSFFGIMPSPSPAQSTASSGQLLFVLLLLIVACLKIFE